MHGVHGGHAPPVRGHIYTVYYSQQGPVGLGLSLQYVDDRVTKRHHATTPWCTTHTHHTNGTDHRIIARRASSSPIHVCPRRHNIRRSFPLLWGSMRRTPATSSYRNFNHPESTRGCCAVPGRTCDTCFLSDPPKSCCCLGNHESRTDAKRE